MTEERLKLGVWGEDQAVSFLRRHGFKIVTRNMRTPVGEVDIVARNRHYLLFVEVKTRRSLVCGSPAEAVGAHKQRQIVRAAQWYLLQGHGRGLQPRFDVISVLANTHPPKVDHIENAFGLDRG
jgi:putative endonuclease